VKRAVEAKLLEWQQRKNKLPLILQGARQVGKSWLMRWLGENHYSKVARFNFDERPELGDFFRQNKDPDRILQSLSMVCGFGIDAETLVILDEIQECPEALNSLKYFAENRPEISIICAGSLLGILLRSGHPFPVGKVEFLQVYPMTFREVLPNWDSRSFAYLEQLSAPEQIPQLFFNDLKTQFKRYLITGGMPAIVRDFTDGSDLEQCENGLSNLLLSYRNDFAKHPVMKDVAKIDQVFSSLPAQLSRENKKFIFQLVRSSARAKEYEDALSWLVQAGLVYKVHRVEKPGIPLSAYEDHHAFKLYALDTGILRKMARLNPLAFSEGDRLFTEFKGALTENYILQSLMAQLKEVPGYWTSGNMAEVDFLIPFENEAIPVEVKSDENVKSRSLKLYQQKYHPPLRIRFSMKNLEYRDGLLNIPLFMADYMREMIKAVFRK
jgi:predicted AAA+ superfamily ATPase